MEMYNIMGNDYQTSFQIPVCVNKEKVLEVIIVDRRGKPKKITEFTIHTEIDTYWYISLNSYVPEVSELVVSTWRDK